MFEKIDNDRIIFRCSDNEHYLYILEAEELEYEGSRMISCFGGDSYKSKVIDNKSIIISLRDKNNVPHVITEVDIESGKIIQQVGKSDLEPQSKYKEIMIEFVLFATNYKNK